ncbi:LAFA_0A02608g1_1 [Lachancea sp. 'fantastica']|nr:LAFA_0A02608g1_1 [Lachancea sp. 'fantastica']
MGRAQAIEFGIKQIPHIIPLDEESARQLCEQVLESQPNEPDKIAEKLMEILGSEDISLNFVLQFNEKLGLKEPPVNSAGRSAQNELKNTIPSARQDTLEPIKLTSKPAMTAKESKAKTSSSVDLKAKQSSSKTQVQEKKPKVNGRTRKLQNLQEIDDVLKVLELESPDTDPAKYVCNCRGTRHPLFEVAPNCLSCGKIICVLEGLHRNNCTYCGTELMTVEETSKIIDVLNQEKLELATTNVPAVQERPKKSKAYKIASGAGTNLFSEQDRLFQKIEREKEREAKRKEVMEGLEQSSAAANKEAADHENEDPELRNAQDRLEKLLHFQDTSDQRTKIIDNASDFSMSNDSNIWGNAQDRALMLKKQQRNIRRWEKLEQERRGKRDKVVMDLVIGKDGKVTMTEASRPHRTAHATDEENRDDISDEEDLKDLDDIANLKGSLAQSSKEREQKLSSNIWDPVKDRKQFKKPVYTGDQQSSQLGVETDALSSNENEQGQNRIQRVQVSQNDENSLEQNILAVL